MGKFIQTEWLVTANGEGKGFPGGAVVKNPPANAGDIRDMGLGKKKVGGETWVWFLGWRGPLKKEMASYSSILAWKNSVDKGVWQATVYGDAGSQIQLSVRAHTPTGPEERDIRE